MKIVSFFLFPVTVLLTSCVRSADYPFKGYKESGIEATPVSESDIRIHR